ncbi:hypothetical protein ALO72_102612, partial [Pseudomonas syringae pv. delphinii]
TSTRSPSGQKRDMCADLATLRLCGSGLVRELPGTGSKTSRLGASDATKVAGLGRFAAHREQVRSHALRAEARYVCGPGDASLVWERTCPRTAGNRQQNQPTRCTRYNQGGRLGPLRRPSRTSSLPRPPGRSAICVRTGRRSHTSEASPGCSCTLRAEALISSAFKPCA